MFLADADAVDALLIPTDADAENPSTIPSPLLIPHEAIINNRNRDDIETIDFISSLLGGFFA